MADNAEDFIIRLNDQVSGPAQAAASAVSSLAAQIAQGGDAVRELEAQMRVLKGASAQDAGAIAELGAKIGANKDVLAQAQQAYIAMGGSAKEALSLAAGGAEALAKAQAEAAAAVEETAKKASEAAAESAAAQNKAGNAAEKAGQSASASKGGVGQLAEATKRLAGPLGEEAEKIGKFGEAIASLGPYGIAAVAAVLVLVGTIAAAAAVFTRAVKAAGVYRDELLKLAGGMDGDVSAAKELQGAISGVASASALSREKVAGYASDLAKAGLKGGELQRALEAMAIAGSAGGDEVAAAFLKSAQAAAASGQSVDQLSAEMKAKLGGVAARQLLSLNAQWEKLQENITALFSGADIEPLLKGIQVLLSVFSQTSASGKSLKATITDFTNTTIGAFLQTAIAAVKLYIALKSNAVAWATLKYSALAVAVIFGVIAAAMLVVIGVVALAGAMLMLPFVLLVAGAMAAWSGIQAAWAGITGAFDSAVAWLSGLSLADIGANMIRGLADGIASSASAVLSAITGVVSGAIAGAKALLGIHSPSTLMRDEIGYQLGAGTAIGVDDSASDVAASTEAMALGAVDAASPSGMARGKAGAKAGYAFTFTNCTFGSGMSREKLEEWLVDIMQRNTLSAEMAT